MDAKDLRGEGTLAERSSDGGAKFALQYDRSKGHDAGASTFKGDAAGARPCAVIGPDRVVPLARDCPKKPPAEPWLDPVYRRLSDYPHKMSDHKDPTRNISPRQTFQENMQRIIMPPGYNAMKLPEDPQYASKNKLNVPLEVKYCEVPYNINPISSDQKHIRHADHSAPNVNPLLMRGVPHGWPASSVNVRPLRPYAAPEVLQYPEYANCTGPRPVLTRTHSSGQEDLQQLYADPYYHESNIRFKPYPNIKERYPQARYEYIGNYPNPYHPPHSYAHKYELPKTMPPHPYSGYPPIPKYTERVSEPVMDGYQRAFSQQGNYSVPIRNPVIHPPYRAVPGAQMQNKLHPYPTDGQHKSPVPNKLPFEPSSKMYLDYDIRSKPLPVTDNYYLNELPRPYHAKNTIVLPNYAPASMHNPHPYYIKENMSMKNYEYAHFKNMDPSMINHSLTKLPSQFSPSTLAISPADSNASNETAQTHGTLQEDCGYVSQSSVASVRSMESLNRIPVDPYGRYDYRYGPVVRNSTIPKPDPNSNQESKSKKDIRQFISSWSEGDDENTESSVKRDGKTIPDSKQTFSKQYEAGNNQEQLYVLGLVNVPSEELSKYEHIQKVSKLPENIKGYNSLELLSQFEEAIESSNITNVKPNTPRAIQMPLKSMPHKQDPIPRAVSPLDVEAKISQSVIHKDVGCNFEIKPCSPKMLNVEVATPMQTLLNERVIEKVANPHNIKSPILLQSINENIDSTLINKSIKCPIPNTASSCKMINSQHISESSAIDHLKTNYSLQDLESNSGVCLASLPRLDTDIELNFPEVNQQFINANKTDSVITASFSKDLPTLDVDRSGSILKNTIPGSEYDMNYQFSPKVETETDFSRLSKYRKLKRIVPDDNNTELAKAQATRVDSVIIKNPDNTRSLEENNDTSGDYYRNDFQEFAMNLVSQVKTSKANHQHEVDKMFSASTSNINPSKYDEIGISSPSGSLIYKSADLINKSLNEVEGTNDSVHIQNEDLSMHSKELLNRCLEKEALDIPMNLSPKDKFSAIGLDEDIQKNRSDDIIKHQDANLNVKLRFDVENICHNKDAKEKRKCTSAVSSDKTDDIVIDPQVKNLNVSNDNICEEPITKLSNLGSSSSLDFRKERDDVEICKNDHKVSQIDEVQASSTITTCREEQITLEKQINVFNLEENIDNSKIQVNNLFEDKRELHSNKTNNVMDFSDRDHDNLSEMDRKKCDSKLHPSKLKRKKYRNETHRKRSSEKNSATTVDGKANIRKADINKEDQNIKMFNSERKDYVKHSINEKPLIISDSVITEHDNKTESSEVCIDNVQNETTTEIQTYSAPKQCSQENDIDVSEKIQDNSDVIKENTALPCSSIEDEHCKLLLKLERDAITQNNLSIAIDNVVTKHNESNDEVFSTVTDLCLNSAVISSNSPKDDDWNRILHFDQLESEEKLSLPNNASINSNEKEINTPVVSDQYEIQSKENTSSIDCDRNKLYTPVDSDQEDKHTYPTLTNANIDCETEELETPVHLVQNEKARRDKQIRLELELIPSKNEDHYQDIQIHNSEDNFLKVSSQHDAKEVVSQRKAHKKDYTNPISRYHPFVNKELFSPRFQNLLLFNENYDICSGDSKSRKNILHDLVIQDSKITAAHKVGIPKNILQCINGISNDSDINMHTPHDTELVDQTGTSEEKTVGKSDKKTDVRSTKDIDFYDNSTANNADDVLKECTKNEILLDKKNNPLSDSHETFTNSLGGGRFDESGENTADTFQKTTKQVILNSSEEEIVPEHDIDSEINYALVTGSTEDNNETQSCETNFIVIEEPTSVTPGRSNEPKQSKIGTPDAINYDLDKKIPSFGRNLTGKPSFSLKRSLSDSALNAYDDNVDNCSEKRCFMVPKRKKITDIGNINESHLLNIIQSSRRNSISTLCNENISFCILIDDNCIVAGENYEQASEFIEFDNDIQNPILKDSIVEDEKSASPIYNVEDTNENNSDTYISKCDEDKSWVEDVGCEETIETEDIAENIVIGEPASPKDTDVSDFESDDENVGMLNSDVIDHTSKVKHIYGDNMCTNDAQLVDALYMTPQMDVNKKLMDRESQVTEKSTKYYDSDSLEMMLSEPITINDSQYVPTGSNTDINSSPNVQESSTQKDKKTSCLEVLPRLVSHLNNLLTNIDVPNEEDVKSIKDLPEPIVSDKAQDGTMQSCESSLDNVFSYIHKEDSSYTSSSSPEVSSTTSEDKNSSILLKISNIEGSRSSEVKNLMFHKQKETSCKFTEKEYLNPNYNNGTSTNRPLLTKAAQKYIPPLKKSVPDLKVKLALPRQSLLKLQKNKVAKEEPKLNARSSTYNNTSNIKPKNEIPKKVKPKFEDVLKNIDKVQFQMHKEKSKKTKKYIPKVVIKKNENGSHYASTSTKDSFNPDLTGRKWQPWVFIEKNQFIDKMALRNKTRAVFSHRRKSFILAEKVCRYKSISSAKFIISQPKINDFTAGNLKYTIKLKHTY